MHKKILLLSIVVLLKTYTLADTILTDTAVLNLEEITVSATVKHQSDNSISMVEADQQYIEQNLSSSLMATLSDLRGVRATTIGSGQSRPIIRGLGLNRLSVIHDGIKHEGQQWGDDHGLEIDQFAIDHVDVIKGPSALLYGSDAIAGALVLQSNDRPTKPFSGKVRLFTRSNNLLFGISANLEGIYNLSKTNGKFFWRLNGTFQDYADYKVPTDSIEYYSYRIALYKRRLRNTAGKEADASLTLGYADYRWHTCLKVYDTYAKSGFFANAHGLEVRLSDIDYDHSNRDIDLPYQQVNHLKLLSHTAYTGDKFNLEANLAWQNNIRFEYSESISHGYMPKPDNNKERSFRKNTATLGLLAQWAVHTSHNLHFGLNAEFQHNRRGGWGFIIPDYENYTIGIFAMEKWTINNNLTLNAGLRYDYAHTHINGYNDWFLTPNENGEEYITRAEDMRLNFHSFTWSAGINYSKDSWLLKANIGKGYRIPIAKELAANGLNYHLFRYEQGNPDLKPETSYQADMTIAFSHSNLQITVEPFIAYFPNYIYLNPTAEYTEGLQMYAYEQSKVLRTGIEAEISYTPWHFMQLQAEGEYLFARQLSGNKKGYALPFSTPWRIKPEIKGLWSFLTDFSQEKNDNKGYASIYTRIVGTQNDIVPPEKPTKGWWTLNIAVSQRFAFSRKDNEPLSISLTLTAENILNKKYFDHTSYYRLIDVPETGWNLTAMVGVDF